MGLLVFLCFTLMSYVIVRIVKKLRMFNQINIRRTGDHSFLVEIFYPTIKIGLLSAQARFEFLAEEYSRFPDLVKFWFGTKIAIAVLAPNRIQKVLKSNKCAEKADDFYKHMNRDKGLIAGKFTERLRVHRRIFNRSFNSKSLEEYATRLVELADSFCIHLSSKIGVESFDLFKITKKFSFDVFCATALGMDIVKFRNCRLYQKTMDAFDVTEETMSHKFSFPFLYPETIFKLTEMFRDDQRAKKVLDEFQQTLANERRIELQANSNNSERLYSKNLVLDQILENEEMFTPEEVRDSILTFMSASETWTNFISHTLLLLAINADIQERLYAEIKKHIHCDDHIKDSLLLAKMPYLDMVIKEALRLMPAVPIMAREAMEDFEMEPGIVLPKGTLLVFNIYALHRQKSIWGPDSHKFNPDNFLPENVAKRHPFSYIPFSSGPRMCTGYKYATFISRITLVKIIGAYKLKTKMKMEDIHLKSYISLKLCSPHMISIEKRA